MRSNAQGFAIPIAPLALGLAGLLPFWGLAVALAVHRPAGWPPAALDAALVSYAAIIVSFLGGIRWGLVVAREDGPGDWARYSFSVLPSLAAWAALLLAEPWRLAVLGLLALVLGAADQALVRSGVAPPWFGRLRLILSGGAGLALLAAAAFWRG